MIQLRLRNPLWLISELHNKTEIRVNIRVDLFRLRQVCLKHWQKFQTANIAPTDSNVMTQFSVYGCLPKLRSGRPDQWGLLVDSWWSSGSATSCRFVFVSSSWQVEFALVSLGAIYQYIFFCLAWFSCVFIFNFHHTTLQFLTHSVTDTTDLLIDHFMHLVIESEAISVSKYYFCSLHKTIWVSLQL